MRTAQDLRSVYRRTSGAVAFIDESFDLAQAHSFYLLAAAIVDSSDLINTREELLTFYGGRAFHASPMFACGEVHSL